MSFSLHPQLAADTFDLGHMPLSQARLVNDARFPWLILVPQRAGIREIIDLAPDDQTILFQEIAVASHALKSLFTPDKLNVAALGNMVPQLHIHVIARTTADAAWPAPVWNHGTATPYEAGAAQTLVARVRETLKIVE